MCCMSPVASNLSQVLPQRQASRHLRKDDCVNQEANVKSCKRGLAEELQAKEGGRWHPAAATEPSRESDAGSLLDL